MKTTNVTTELAKERNREAAERTLTSWIQSCLTLIVFGFAFDRIVNAFNQTLRRAEPVPWERAAPYVALGAIGLGMFLLTLAVAAHRNQMKALEQPEYGNALSAEPFALATGAIVLFGLVAAVFVLIKWL